MSRRLPILNSSDEDKIPHRNKSFCAHGINCEFNALTCWETNVPSSLYKCRGATKHDCTSYMLQKCWMASHRCGIGECKCNCKECLANTFIESGKKLSMSAEDQEKVDGSTLDYWVSNNDEATQMTPFAITSVNNEALSAPSTKISSDNQIITNKQNEINDLEYPEINTAPSDGKDPDKQKCYYTLEKMNLTDDEEIMSRIHSKFQCDSCLVCIKYGSHPNHRDKDIGSFDTSAAIYNLTYEDLVVIIWDDTASTRTVEIVDQLRMKNMCEDGILRTIQLDVSTINHTTEMHNNDASFDTVQNEDLESVIENGTIKTTEHEVVEVTNFNEAVDLSENEVSEVDIANETVDLSGNEVVEVNMTNEMVDLSGNDVNSNDSDRGDGINEFDDENEVGFVTEEVIIDDNELNLNGSLEDRFLKDYANTSVKADASKFRVSVVSKFSLDKNTPDSWYIIPETTYDDEKRLHDQLIILNDISKNIENVKLTIGGRDRMFWSFHYPAENSYPSNDRRGIWEFVELNEVQLLYRYDIKAVMAFNCKDRGYGRTGRGKPLRPRLFISYFYLVCNKCDKFAPKRFVLVSILTTLCISPFNVYVIWDNLLETMIEWQGENIIKYFWCDFSSKIDHKVYRERLDFHFRRRSYYYDKSRTIPRDYHNIGNMDPKFDTTPEIAIQRLDYWNLTVGLRQAVSSVPSKREIKPVQQYIGYETAVDNCGGTKKRGPAVNKQQQAALNAKNKKQKLADQKLLIERSKSDIKRKEYEDSEIIIQNANKKLKSGTTIESTDEIMERFESCMESVIQNNSQLSGQIGKIASKVDTALVANRKMDEMILKFPISQPSISQTPPIDEFHKEMFEHLKIKDLSASDKDAFLIKQFVSNHDKHQMVDRSLISLRMWLCFAGFAILVIFVCLCLGYISMVVSKAVTGNIKVSVNV